MDCIKFIFNQRYIVLLCVLFTILIILLLLYTGLNYYKFDYKNFITDLYPKYHF